MRDNATPRHRFLLSALDLAALDPAPVAAYIQAEFQRFRELIDEEHIPAMIHERISNDRSNRRRRCRNHDGGEDMGANEAQRRRQRFDYDRERASNCVEEDYFANVPRFNDKQFERFFRITRSLARMILEELGKRDSFWTLRQDCTGRWSIDPRVKLVAALKMMCYGESFSAWQDYCPMGESTARECLSKLSTSIFLLLRHIHLK
jgi:hypothetical protein